MSETSSEEQPQLMTSEKQCPSIPQMQGNEQGHDLTLDTESSPEHRHLTNSKVP